MSALNRVTKPAIAQRSPSGAPLHRSGTSRGYLLVIGAATAWGTLGLFYKGITQHYGLLPETIVLFRAGVALAALLVVLIGFRRDLLRIQLRHVPLLIAQGAIGIAAFYLVYIYAVQIAGMAVAVVLMYTAPVWVTLYSWRFLGDTLDGRKLLALAGTLAGAAFVARVGSMSLVRAAAPGIALGLGSGLCYACYSILNKYALRHYSSWTVLTYGLAFGLPLLAVAQSPTDVSRAVTTPGAMVWLLALGLGPSLGGALLYAAGLAELPASVASIVASFEPVVASALAFLVLGEQMAPGQLVGAALILASIVTLASSDLVARTRSR
jgi:DME family drug/metabolite transporter